MDETVVENTPKHPTDYLEINFFSGTHAHAPLDYFLTLRFIWALKAMYANLKPCVYIVTYIQ